jgi:4-hydroxyphenylpyruvate dioxygenase
MEHMSARRFSCTTATFGGKLPEKLRAMQAAGFAATEFWPRDLFEHADGPDTAVELLRETGLTVSAYQALRNFEGMSPEVRARKLDIAKQLMDQMAFLGADLLVLCSNTAPESSGDHGRIAEDLAVLGELARSRGLRVAYEALCWGRWIRDYRDAWRVVKATAHENVGIMLDSFHVYALDLPLDGIGEIPADKIFLVEVADLPGTNLDLVEVSREYRLFPGEGVTPIADFVRQVRKTGYAGQYSIEVFNAQYRAMAAEAVAERAMRCMRALFSGIETG